MSSSEPTRAEPRADDFARRRAHLAGLDDAALHARFWEAVTRLVAPLVEDARTHTTPAIERSVLLRMGFSSPEAKGLVEAMAERRVLGAGAGRLVLECARRRGTAVREAGLALLAGEGWDGDPTR